MNYQGKNVVITGAGGGMGKLLCKRLAQQGAKLSLCDVCEEKLKALADELADMTEVFYKAINIACEADVQAFYEEAYAKNGEFYALANLAGLSIPGQIPETSENTYDTIMDVNVKGTFLSCKFFVPRAADGSIIVNIGSMAAINANGNAPLYCTAKASVNMFSRGLLLQVGSRNIRVTTVNPGGTDTRFWGDRPVDHTKLMQPEDVVEILLFVLNSSPNVQIHHIDFESIARF